MKTIDLRTNQQKVYDLVTRNPSMTRKQSAHMRGSCAKVSTLTVYFYTFRAVTKNR